MKIGQGQTTIGGAGANSLIEQMQKAHAESVEKAGGSSKTSRSFSVDQAQGASSAPGEQISSLDRKVVSIAERVLKGELGEPAAARKEVLHAIIEDRYAGMLGGSKKRQAIKTLEGAMLEDPTFSREVDRMLILAAQKALLP